MFDNGLRHTIRLELHTVYDISRQRPVAKEWLGALMALVCNESYDLGRQDGGVDMMKAIASHRGATCGVR